MSKKKGKALALELVGDLFKDDKSKKTKKKKSAKAESKNIISDSTEIVIQSPATGIVNEDATAKLTKEDIEKFSSVNTSFPTIPGRDMNYGQSVSSTEVSLRHSMNLKKAQEKILELEKIIEDQRSENEKLFTASQTFKKHSDELQSKLNDVSRDREEQKIQFKEEKQIVLDSMNQTEGLLRDIQLEKEQLQSRLNTNLKKIRVRERELENRLEIVRLENLSLQRSKDEQLLDLKRQIDDAQFELESYRDKGKVLDMKLEKKKEMLRKTVKALRLALTMLESNEQEIKKVSGDNY